MTTFRIRGNEHDWSEHGHETELKFGSLVMKDSVGLSEVSRGLVEADLFGHPYDDDACTFMEELFERF